MGKEDKLRDNLKNIQTGDILFVRGDSFLAFLIRLFDKWCKWNHTGVVVQIDGIYYVLESLGEGATLSFLSKRIDNIKDFTIYRPEAETLDKRIGAINLINQVNDLKIARKYDKPLLLKIAFGRLLNRIGFTKHWFVQDNTSEADICSELTRRYLNTIGVDDYSEAKMKERTGKTWITPMDFIRYNSGKLIQIC